MHRAKAVKVLGNKVLADGAWLKCIGNNIVSEGEWIWTDGRCVYGHNLDSGAIYVPAAVDSGGIPIIREWWEDDGNHPFYMYYVKNELHTIGQGNNLGKLLNRGNRFAFLDEALLDAEYDSAGNLYTLEPAYITCDWATGNYITEGGACVKKNGEIIRTYDLYPYITSLIAEATAKAQAQTTPVSGDDAGSETYTSYFYCTTLGGRVDENGNFKVVVHLIIEVTHEEYAYYTEYGPWGGSDTYMYGNRGSAELCRRIFIDGNGTIEPWFKGERLLWSSFNAGGYGGGNSRLSEDTWYAPDDSIRYPVHDGMYMTFAGTADFLTRPSDGGNYTASIYSEHDELLLTLAANPLNRLSLCKLGNGKFLLCKSSYLYLWDNGNLTELARSCQNFRLRKMSNLKAWKRTGGV